MQDKLHSPIWGWFGARQPFDFNLDYEPAQGLDRFLSGTPAILSMKAIEPALDIILEAGMENLRRKSILQTEYLIYLADQRLASLGFEIASPRNADVRGSHIALKHPEAYRINKAMIEAAPPAVCVIPDFRTPDIIRLGVAPLFNTFEEIYLAIDRIKTIVEDDVHLQFSKEQLAVT